MLRAVLLPVGCLTAIFHSTGVMFLLHILTLLRYPPSRHAEEALSPPCEHSWGHRNPLIMMALWRKERYSELSLDLFSSSLFVWLQEP